MAQQNPALNTVKVPAPGPKWPGVQTRGNYDPHSCKVIRSDLAMTKVIELVENGFKITL